MTPTPGAAYHLLVTIAEYLGTEFCKYTDVCQLATENMHFG